MADQKQDLLRECLDSGQMSAAQAVQHFGVSGYVNAACGVHGPIPCPGARCICASMLQVAVAPNAAAGPYPTAMRPATADEAAAIGARFSGAGLPKETLQQRVEPWLLACFGAEIAADTDERNHRFLEESLELVQACGCTASEAHQLVDYVFGRPVGEKHQEAGGVMITLAALCRAQGMDMHEAGEVELARIWTMVEKIRAKQAAKPKHSPLPVAASPAAAAGGPTEAMNVLRELFEAHIAYASYRSAEGHEAHVRNRERYTAAWSAAKLLCMAVSPVAPVGAPTLSDEQIDTAWQQAIASASARTGVPPAYVTTDLDTHRGLRRDFARALLSRPGCELATDATKQLGEPSPLPLVLGAFAQDALDFVHLAATPIDQDFRMRPASSEAAPSADVPLSDLARLRQWFDAVNDLNPLYLEDADRELMQRLEQGAIPSHASEDAKDAQRYRWLREHKPLAIHNACPMLDEEWIDPFARADRVIDAAIAATPGERS